MANIIKPLLCKNAVGVTSVFQKPFLNSVITTRFKHKPRKLKTSGKIPKGGPVPPEHETVAYIPVPSHLTPESWLRRGETDRKWPILWHEDWPMQKDAYWRAVSVYYGPLRTRLNCIRFNGFLPLELKQVADQEICTFPAASDKSWATNRCVLTSRPRGYKRRWRISRIVWRDFADHGQISGIIRAKW